MRTACYPDLGDNCRGSVNVGNGERDAIMANGDIVGAVVSADGWYVEF